MGGRGARAFDFDCVFKSVGWLAGWLAGLLGWPAGVADLLGWLGRLAGLAGWLAGLAGLPGWLDVNVEMNIHTNRSRFDAFLLGATL